MKTTRFLIAAMASLLAIASCEQPESTPDNETPGNENGNGSQDKTEVPQIMLRETSITLASGGESVNVAYMIENEVNGVKLNVTDNADWLQVNTEKARIITLTAEVNESGEDRSTELVLSYEGAEDVTLEVTQPCFINPLKVMVSDVTATGVTFSVTTSDDALTWIPMVTYKESFEYFDTPDELFANDLEYFAYLADIQDMNRAEFIESMVAVGSLEDVTLDGLQPSTDYVLYAYGITPEGRRTTDIVSSPFRTDDPYEGDLYFEFEASEEDYILNYTITPNYTGVPFYYDIMTKDRAEDLKYRYGDLRSGIQAEEIDPFINELLELGMIEGPEDYFLIYSESNVVDWGYYELKAATSYVLYAVKWDEQCKLIGPVSTYEHTSQPVDMSENQITLEVANVTQSSADAVVTVTNDDPYVVMPIRKSEVENLTDDELFVYVSTKYDYLIGEYTYTGNNTKTFSRMRSDTEYMLIAFGFKAGTMTTAEIDKVTFTTLPAGDPAECTFEFNCTPGVEDAFIEVIPSDKGHFYHWLVYPSYYTADDVKEYLTLTIDIAYEGDVATFSSWELSLGDDSANAWDLVPDTEYKVGAVVMDYDTGEFLSEVAFSEPFTTLEKIYADLEFVFTYGPYYDLGQLVQAGQTQFASMLTYGDALFPVQLRMKGKCSAFFYDIYQNDLSDTDKYTDETFYPALESAGCTYSSSYVPVRYDQYMTLVAMAYDYDGNVTRLYRDVLFFTQDGASPVSEFIETLPKSASLASVEGEIEPAEIKVATKKLRNDSPSVAEMQTRHDEAMTKIRNMRLEKFMKDSIDAKYRKEKMVAR